MRRSLCLTFWLFLAACSTKSAGSQGREPGEADEGAANPSATDGQDSGAVVVLDEAGAPVDVPSGSDGPAPPPPATKPPPYISFDAMVDAIRADLKTFGTAIERKDVRYLVLSHLGNALLTNEELAVHRSTMNLLVNSLSRGAELVAPQQLAAAPNVYRINLRDYRWTPQLWEAIVADYPYQVQYKRDSQLFPHDEDTAANIRTTTGTNIPFVFIEWFANKVTRAPLYYQLLNFPETLADLGKQVDVDIAADIAEQRIARAGVTTSTFAKQNRMLERHDRVGNAGVFWLSYDFSQSSGVQKIFDHPFDFQHVGQEVIYALPNGLSAYMVVDAKGKRLDAAPFDVAADGLAKNAIAAPGLSCMGGCHYAQGFEGIKDEVRVQVLAKPPAGVDPAAVRAVFPEQANLDALLAKDRKVYIDAATALGVDLGLKNAPYQTINFYQGEVNLPLAAALLELTEAEMDLALARAPLTVPAQIRGLREGNLLTRQVFEALLPKAVCELGIGEPICAARACGCATLAP